MNPLALIGWQRYLVYGGMLLAIGAALIGYGYHLGIRNLWEYQADQARAAVPVIVKQGSTTEKIVTVYRDRIALVKEAAQVIEKEIVRYVPPSADPVLPRGWLLLHDAAATGAVPKAPEGIDVAAPAVAASTALRGVAGNYGTCHATAAQLVALQSWVREQYAVMNLEQIGY
jgi:hypothetical protein